MQLPLLTILILLQFFLTQADIGYYWRDYHSKIPKDAFPAGKDINGKETYIGQTVLHNLGIFVMQIFSDSSKNTVAYYSVQNPSPAKKILCSKHHKRFSWYPTTAKTFLLDTIHKKTVIGGYDHVDANRGMIQIGRVEQEGGFKIGTVVGYQIDNSPLYFNSNGAIRTASSFEVLVFDNKGLEGQYYQNATNSC